MMAAQMQTNEGTLQSLFDTLLDTLADGVITLNEYGDIQFYNKICEMIFGYSAEEVLGKNIDMLMLKPMDIAEIKGNDLIGKRKDGFTFPMDLSVGDTGEQGDHAFVWVIHDSTSRKEAENKERLLASIVESSEDGIISKTLDGIITSWNSGATHLFGYSPQEAIGRHICFLIPREKREEEKYILEQIKQGQRVKHSETVRLHKNSHLVYVSLTVSPICDAQGKIVGASKIARDITERREGEKAREQLRQAQKMEALGQLTGGIAHDFNNLLAVVMGNLDFIAEQVPEDSPLHSFIKPSLEAAEHGAELTKQLLAFGRKQTLQPKVISLNELLHYLLALVRHTLGERMHVITALSADLWNINVDPTQLQNALLNLAVNARDAMPSGGKLIFETRNIHLDEEYVENNSDVVVGDYVEIAVSDTGQGMTAAVIEKAFEPFFTTKEVGKGSGLGLSMVYGFVKQSSGHIKIYSELGQGTSIKIYLPKAEGELFQSEQVKAKSTSGKKKGKLILVVEDNKDVLRLTSEMVRSLGYNILTAENGDDAIPILKANPEITLLLTDVMLPRKINGPALAQQAVAIYPHLKVLFNSGYTEQAILQSGLLEEGVNLISKPFRKQQLALKLEELFKVI